MISFGDVVDVRISKCCVWVWAKNKSEWLCLDALLRPAFVVMRPGFPRRRIRVDKRHVTPHGETVKHLKMHHFDHFALTFCISHQMTSNDVIMTSLEVITLAAKSFLYVLWISIFTWKRYDMWHINEKSRLKIAELTIYEKS